MSIKNKPVRSKSRGFTLVELLVTISIIAILITIAVNMYGNAKARSRDSKRVAEIRSIQNALAFYWDSFYYYPSDFVVLPGTAINGSTDILSVALKTAGALQTVPIDPQPGQDAGFLYQLNYYYRSTDAQGNGYELTYCLETDSAAGGIGCHTVGE